MSLPKALLFVATITATSLHAGTGKTFAEEYPNMAAKNPAMAKEIDAMEAEKSKQRQLEVEAAAKAAAEAQAQAEARKQTELLKQIRDNQDRANGGTTARY